MPTVRTGTPLRLFWKVHRAYMRATGGRFGRVGAMPVLLLTTRGRKTGERRDVALNYARADGSFVVVASYAGEDRDPAWWQNLKAHPEAEVTLDGKRVKVRARECDGARRQLLWTGSSRRIPRTRSTSGARSAGSPSSCSIRWDRAASGLERRELVRLARKDPRLQPRGGRVSARRGRPQPAARPARQPPTSSS